MKSLYIINNIISITRYLRFFLLKVTTRPVPDGVSIGRGHVAAEDVLREARDDRNRRADFGSFPFAP